MSGGVLLLSWLLSVGTVNYQLGVQQGDVLAGYRTPPGTFATTLGVEGLLWEHVFASADVTTWERFNGGGFSPSQSLYTFSVGARTNGIEVGLRHECDHITLSSFVDGPMGFASVRTEAYVSVRGSFSPF